MSNTIHQEIVFDAPATAVYSALMDTAEHAQFTGAPAEVSADEGGGCSWYGGHVTGRNVELRPGQRIVQVWRAANWEPGVYSLIKYELHADGKKTRVVFDQVGHPEGTGEHLEAGWHERYWNPLTKYFADR